MDQGLHKAQQWGANQIANAKNTWQNQVAPKVAQWKNDKLAPAMDKAKDMWQNKAVPAAMKLGDQLKAKWGDLTQKDL